MTFTRKHMRALLTTTPRPGPTVITVIASPRGWVPDWSRVHARAGERKVVGVRDARPRPGPSTMTHRDGVGGRSRPAVNRHSQSGVARLP